MKRSKTTVSILLVILMIFLLIGCTGVNVPNNNLPNETPGTNDPSNGNSDNEIKKSKNIENFISEEKEVPRIIINTDDRAFPYNKVDYINGTLKIVEQPNVDKVIFEEAQMGIRLRGNSTMECPKKAFRVKFKEKQSLFGLEKAKNWVLLANYFDKSHMRNYLAYLTANKLDNLYFQPSSIFVEVEFNGEYLGLYLLCEQMETGKGRVDIEQDVFSTSNPSYFMELDFKDRLLEDGLEYNKSFFGSNGLYFGLKYPDEKEITAAQCRYIKEFMDKAFNFIKAKDNYDLLIDVDSFIDYYIVNELFKNVDSVQTSVYLYFENGILYAGPVWDFDIALGVVGKNEVNNMYEGYENSTLWLRENSLIYQLLFEDPSFLEKVKDRYTEVRSILGEVYTEMLTLESVLQEEFARENAKWSIPGEMYMWLCGHYSVEYRSLTTIEEHISYLKKQLNKQFMYLDNAYLVRK